MSDSDDGPFTWRQWLGLILAATVALGVGLTGLGGGIRVKVGSTLKADRLEKSGQPVLATLSDYQPGRSRAAGATVWVSYEFGGRRYRVWTECAVEEICRPERATTMPITVDPERPDEFVTVAGGTDDSRHWLNSWKVIIIGLMASIVGTGLSFGCVHQLRWESRRRRRLRNFPGKS